MAGSADEVSAQAAADKKLADLETRLKKSEDSNKSILDEITALKSSRVTTPVPEPAKKGFFEQLLDW